MCNHASEMTVEEALDRVRVPIWAGGSEPMGYRVDNGAIHAVLRELKAHQSKQDAEIARLKRSSDRDMIEYALYIRSVLPLCYASSCHSNFEVEFLGGEGGGEAERLVYEDVKRDHGYTFWDEEEAIDG